MRRLPTFSERRVQSGHGLALVAAGLLALGSLWSCESHKDPFSAGNTAPVIRNFAFKPDVTLPDARLRASGDSLKYRAGEAYAIALQYEDAELRNKNRPLRASFKFLAGSGRLVSTHFSNPGADGLSFDVPPQLNDEIFLIPAKSGIVDLQLQISDGVKDSEVKLASTTFFENLKPLVRFRVQLGGQQNPPYGVDFDASSSTDRDGTISAYVWSFGDNSSRVTSRSSTIHHDYLRSGSYTVRLIIRDEEGAADSLDRVVTTFNQPPVAALSVTPTVGSAPLTIIYNARGSRDGDGEIVAYDITFGDGGSSQADSGSYTYLRDSPPNSPYVVRLTVRDNVGATSSETVPVTVVTPPVADFIWRDCDLGNVTFISTSYDPNAPPNDAIDNYEWDFGDGTMESGATLSTVRHSYARSGEYPVQLRVRNRNVTGEVIKQVKIPCN
ncbi:MAG: PKD domain-containing protein [candidate division KSB1 bacterium]|nr:PKD domain-containing protein [candidate division KSB1 bacterium]MDZ7273749.1 PKD domain-containing protein [candidate division KSB1 bacterium]MDZ7285905.1 PKD domain-containing protein [candidate division KSB1 bacterium]MDZ7298937.1 PKD domain-containing protein [candidate division KSB1 bacterium]MDZ7307612.1 PKD domain-containing protein [candidate division KSB1 bacterium]